jgi:hypothetical protein
MAVASTPKQKRHGCVQRMPVMAEQQARLQVERDVRNAFTTWSSQREVLRIQSDAVNTAQINFERTRELFQAGQLTGLQFRQAQLDLANAERQSVVAGLRYQSGRVDAAACQWWTHIGVGHSALIHIGVHGVDPSMIQGAWKALI